MDTARVSWLVAPGSNPGRGGHCGMLLRKTLNSRSHCIFPPNVSMGTREFNARGYLCDGLTSHSGGSRKP